MHYDLTNAQKIKPEIARERQKEQNKKRDTDRKHNTIHSSFS
jgi:hypothetical protein